MSIWDWVRESASAAYENGDEQRQQLFEIWQESRDLEEVPDAAMEAMERGRRLAVSLRESWWALFFEHWKLQLLLNQTCDNTRALPLAVAATVEARKPAYAGCPQRLCVHDDLVSTYLSLDGPGYAAEIEDALTYMQTELAEGAECRFCILQNRVDLAEVREQRGDVRREAERLLRASQEDANDFNAVYAHAWLCLACHREGDLTRLGMHAAEGLALCEEEDLPVHKAEFCAWRALLASRDRQPSEAAYHLRQGEAALAGTTRPASARYFEALRACHEGDAEKLLAVCEREIASVSGKSQHHREAVARLERCRLLKELGRPVGEAVEEARGTIGRLRQPAALLGRLAQIEAT